MELQKKEKAELLEGARWWVKREKESTVRVLEYVAEIDRRRLWLEEGYSSLHDFCVRFLGYAEGEAARRMHAARCMTNIPGVKALLQANRLSLSGVGLIAPYLSVENEHRMLPMVEGKTTREIKTVLVEEFDAPAREKLLHLVLDEEFESLLKELEKHYSEKDRLALLKRAAREILAKQRKKEERAARVSESLSATRTEAANAVPVPPPKARPIPRHTRYIPAAIRRIVQEESGARCAYTAASGQRCNQTAHLQFDHVRPWAKGGSSRDAGNLRMLCKAHNLFLAQRDFPKFVAVNQSGGKSQPQATASRGRCSRATG